MVMLGSISLAKYTRIGFVEVSWEAGCPIRLSASGETAIPTNTPQETSDQVLNFRGN